MRAKDPSRFDLAALRNLAGDQTFAHGEAYRRDGLVTILRIESGRVLAQVTGTEDYRIELTGRGKTVRADDALHSGYTAAWEGEGCDMSKSKPITIYGIKNCDTMKKARAWLDARGVAYAFHDYKAAGIERAKLESWAREVGWETLLNRAGTTFRKLPEPQRENLTAAKAIALMLAQPSMIKRPVLDIGGKLMVGFKAEQYEQAFSVRPPPLPTA